MTGAARHYLLFPSGSHGDVHPFAGLARELVRRGERVSVFAAATFAHLFEPAGIAFTSVMEDARFRALLEDPTLWEPGIASARRVFEYSVQLLDLQYDAVAAHRAGDPRLVVGPLALGARIAGEVFDIPAATVQLAPAVFMSAERPPILPGFTLPAWLPVWARRALLRVTDRVTDRVLFAGLARERATRGLAPVRGYARGWMNSPALTVALFPDWFAPPASDWPRSVRTTGFPLYDESDAVPAAPEVGDFLDATAALGAPLVFTPGSAMVHGQHFFAAAIGVCRELGRPGILLSRHHAHLPATLPAQVRHFDYVPLSRLLPRTGALVHHGGIGTLSQALAAGVPQLVAALAHDQFDNAARVEALGVGAGMDMRDFDAARGARRLRALMDDPRVPAACAAVRARVAGASGIPAACDLLQAMA